MGPSKHHSGKLERHDYFSFWIIMTSVLVGTYIALAI